jgi:prepilin-type N-terminal cleavage/methylation domain-containing protein
MHRSERLKGFTLIEILIALAILGTLSILVATSIQRGVKNKAKIQDQLDDISKIRNALKIMEMDIHKAFHYYDVEKEFLDEIKKASQQGPSAPKSDSPPGSGAISPLPSDESANALSPGTVNPVEAPRVAPVFHFLGEDSKLNFVTRNMQRTLADSRVADFQEVGYEFKDCESLKSERSKGKCIWRRSSSIVDKDLEKGGEEMVLLDHLTEFSLKYIGKGKQDWVTQWKSSPQGGDSVTTNNFPLAVQISLTYEREVRNEKDRKYSMQIVVPLRFPNNKAQ